MSDPKVTCERLVTVIRSRSQLYAWPTHRAALELIGDLSCPRALDALQDYSTLLSRSSDSTGLVRFSRFVKDQPAPTLESIELLKTANVRAIDVLTSSEGSTR